MDCIDGTLAHYWEIEPSNGSTSKGKCKKCGGTQRFHNSIGAVTSWKEAGQQFQKKVGLTNLGRKKGE